MQVFHFLMIKVDVPIILGNFEVDFLIEIFMRFFFKKSLNPNPADTKTSYQRRSNVEFRRRNDVVIQSQWKC